MTLDEFLEKRKEIVELKYKLSGIVENFLEKAISEHKRIPSYTFHFQFEMVMSKLDDVICYFDHFVGNNLPDFKFNAETIEKLKSQANEALNAYVADVTPLSFFKDISNEWGEKINAVFNQIYHLKEGMLLASHFRQGCLNSLSESSWAVDKMWRAYKSFLQYQQEESK